MKDPIKIEAMDLGHAARCLVQIAAERGLVLTIERVPLLPLAMGNATNKITIRPARGGLGDYAPKQRPPLTGELIALEDEAGGVLAVGALVRDDVIWQEMTDECGGQP